MWNTKGLKSSAQRFDYEYTDDELGLFAGQIGSLSSNTASTQFLCNINYEDQGPRAASKLTQLLGVA